VRCPLFEPAQVRCPGARTFTDPVVDRAQPISREDGDYCKGTTRDRYPALQTMCAAASATVFFVVGGAMGSSGRRAPFWIYAAALLPAPAIVMSLPRTAPAHSRPDTTARTSVLSPYGSCPASACCGVRRQGLSHGAGRDRLPAGRLGVSATAVIGVATAVAEPPPRGRSGQYVAP
jgi:hypothetical protein